MSVYVHAHDVHGRGRGCQRVRRRRAAPRAPRPPRGPDRDPHRALERRAACSGAHQPHLRSLADRVLQPTGVDALAGHDVVVLALPHGASGAIAAELEALGDGAVVVDLGADHRLVDAADWEAFYGSAHAGTWPYGLPELLHPGERTAQGQRAVLAGARRIAVPGCNVTAVSLGLQPGVAAGLIEPTDLVAVLANGYSGAGKSLKTHLLASEALGSAQPYAVGGTHRHVRDRAEPAVRRCRRRDHLVHADPRADGARDPGDGHGPPRCRRRPEHGPRRVGGDVRRRAVRPAAARGAVADDGCDAGCQHRARSGRGRRARRRVVTVTAIDNLVKGAAGGALQSLNLALGLPETLGLPLDGVSP